MTWYDDAGHGDAKGHALRTGDYVDPRDALPTLADCQRDEAEAQLYDFGGGPTDTFLGSTS